ncbi:MAG: hypothetical protein ACJAT7_000179 [Psychromonas sp.]
MSVQPFYSACLAAIKVIDRTSTNDTRHQWRNTTGVAEVTLPKIDHKFNQTGINNK